MTFELNSPTSGEKSPQRGVAFSYHELVATMEYLNSGQAKRAWRKAIKDAWGNCCCFCGRPPISNTSLTIDHLKPRHHGGQDTSNNCLPACLEHNQAKGTSEWREWFRSQDCYSAEREARIQFWLRHSRIPDEIELAVEMGLLPAIPAL